MKILSILAIILYLGIFSQQTTAPSSGCAAISDEGRCYSYFNSSVLNWQDARDMCIALGGDLATITSLEENTILSNIEPGSTNCWIGLNDIDVDNTFVWADGTESTYRQWFLGQPDNHQSNEDCVEISGEEWNDRPCQSIQGCYFCGTTVSEAPSQLIVSNATSTSFCITISPPANVTQNGVIQSYIVSYQGELFNTTQVNVSVSVVATYPLTALSSVCINGLEEFNNYTVAVRAVNGAGEGAAITDVFRTLASAPASPPITITVTVINSTALNATWNVPDVDEHNGLLLQVDIQVQGINLDTTERLIIVLIDDSNDTSIQYHIITGLEEFVNYSVIFRVRNGAGLSPLSDPVFESTLQAAPSSPPQNVMTQALSPTSMGVTFTPPLAINQNGLVNSYNVTYIGQTFDNTTQLVIVNVSNVIYPATVEILSVNLTGLQDNNNYTVRVSAINQIGASPFSDGIIQIIDIAVNLPDAIPLVVSSITFFTAFVSWSRTDRTPFLMENYTLVYSIGYSSPINQPIPDGSTSFTLTGLLPNSNYTAYVFATNIFGYTVGPTASFTTELIRLYFFKGETVVPFRTGSIFRGGMHSDIFDVVSEYHCSPDSPDQVITWYQPDGTVIPPGIPSSTGFYHTRNTTTGESVFYTNNAVSLDNEGNNFTCRFNQTSGVMNMSSFGIYYARKDVGLSIVRGIRLYGPDKTIYEFVYQRGVFNIDYTQSYTVQCLVASLSLPTNWTFIPVPLYPSDTATTNTTIYQVLFDPNAVCQYIRCAPFVQYTAFSNKSFLLQSDPDNITQNIECIPNDYEYSFSLGAPLDISLTCPLIFGARFLDIGADITLIQNEISTNSSRRLYINPAATIATLDKDRTYVCEDRYGEMVSFRISINTAGSDPIQILPNGSSTVPIVNGTNLIGSANIPNALLCVTQNASNAANWYVDSNPNRNTGQSPVLVTTDSSILPHVISPREGRSNLVLNGTIGDTQQGYYSCVTNPLIILGIFSQTPVAPTADISPNQSSIQVVMGTDTPTLRCVTSNVPHPLPIYFWTGSVSSSTATLNTGLLLEADTGMYTCTASNVVDQSTESIMIIVVPPSPQFNSIQSGTASPIYLDDPFTLECEFSTFSNVTSQIAIRWYQNNTQVVETTSININTAYSGSVAISSLTVSTSQIDQTGDYQCRATVGGSQQAISLILPFSFDLPPKPNFINIILLTEGTIVVGDTFMLACEFMTLQKFVQDLSISWYFNNVILNTSLVVVSESISGTDTVKSILSVNTATLSPSGAYHCVATVLDSLPSITSLLNVTIHSAPTPVFVDFNLSATPVYISDSFSLSCRFSISTRFVSSLTIDWFHNNTVLPILYNSAISSTFDGNTVISTLSINNAGYERSGSYSCSVGVPGSSFVSSNQINVIILPIPPPTFTSIGLTTQHVYLNGSFQLFCLFNALPRVLPFTTVKWYHNTTEISPCHSRYLINLQHDAVGSINSTLQTVSSEECQLGTYYCEAIFEQLISTSHEYILSFETVPYDQEILSLDVVSIDGSSLYIQWELSHAPDADERFSVKFTIQLSNNTVTVKLVDLNCDLTCDRDQRVSYKLTDIETNSIYLAEVSVINLYGQSSKIYQFYPQAIISEAIGDIQYKDNSATIAISLVIVILSLLSGYVTIFVLLMVWYLRHYRTKRATLKHKMLSTPEKQYVEMSPRDTTTDGYYNQADERCDNPQLYAESNIAPVEAVAETVYAHIDEDSKVIEEAKTD